MLEKWLAPVDLAMVLPTLVIASLAGISPSGIRGDGFYLIDPVFLVWVFVLGSLGLLFNRRRLLGWNYIVAGFAITVGAAVGYSDFIRNDPSILPSWLLLISLPSFYGGCFALASLLLWLVQSKAYTTGFCPKCGYNLHGLHEPITCPECGWQTSRTGKKNAS